MMVESLLVFSTHTSLVVVVPLPEQRTAKTRSYYAVLIQLFFEILYRGILPRKDRRPPVLQYYLLGYRVAVTHNTHRTEDQRQRNITISRDLFSDDTCTPPPSKKWLLGYPFENVTAIKGKTMEGNSCITQILEDLQGFCWDFSN